MKHKGVVFTDEEMLGKLKAEIIRIGLEDTPSRLKVVALYNKDNIPHPLTYMTYFGSWKDILKRIGLEEAKKVPKPAKEPKVRWEDLPEEVWLEKLIVELCRVGLNENPSITELRKVYNKKNIPAPSTYKDKLGNWENVLQKIETDARIKRKRGRTYRKETVIKDGKPKEVAVLKDTYVPETVSKHVLINVVLDEMKTKKLYARKDYESKHKQGVLPNMYEFERDTGLNWTELWKLYVDRNGDPIKQERESYTSNLNLFLVD